MQSICQQAHSLDRAFCLVAPPLATPALLVGDFGNFGLVVSAGKGKGGTWSGAVEELRRAGGTPVLVRAEGQTPEGNAPPMRLRARALPARPGRAGFAELLADLADSSSGPAPSTAPARKGSPSRAKPRQMQLFEEGSKAEDINAQGLGTEETC